MLSDETLKPRPGPAASRKPTRRTGLSEISRRLLLENYAPAAVVINQQHEILFSTGAVGQYLSLAAGQPTLDLLAMASLDLRGRLRVAIQDGFQIKVPARVDGGKTLSDGAMLPYHIDLLPVPDEESLLLICFVSEPPLPDADRQPAGSQPAILEQELQAVRAELQGAIRDFEISNEEHRAINEDALTANEEYQARIAELMDWKSGLEALAKEMTDLNGQLQETLAAQRNTSSILGNILDNIGAALLLLDCDLKIRFFTPAIQPFFHLIASDTGRPLGDLHYLAPDGWLTEDCETVLRGLQPLDREIELASNRWFLRRILPYRADNGEVDGLVISFSDITETRAMLMAQAAANAEQTRHLTGAGGTLRHRLQTLTKLQGTLKPNLSGGAGDELIRLIGQTANALSTTLNSLLDSKQIDASPPETRDYTAEKTSGQREGAVRRIANLTPRERQIMKLVVAGRPSKIIATDLRISQRTVENHRAAIMRKTESRSLPALARVAFASGLSNISEEPPEAFGA